MLETIKSEIRYLYRLLFQKYTVEDILVFKVQSEIKQLIDGCPFKYLLTKLELDIPNKPGTKINFIIQDKQLYLDFTGALNNQDLKLIDLSKYCFKFNGKFKNFKEFGHYQFYWVNRDYIAKYVNIEIESQKVIYGL